MKAPEAPPALALSCVLLSGVGYVIVAGLLQVMGAGPRTWAVWYSASEPTYLISGFSQQLPLEMHVAGSRTGAAQVDWSPQSPSGIPKNTYAPESFFKSQAVCI